MSAGGHHDPFSPSPLWSGTRPFAVVRGSSGTLVPASSGWERNRERTGPRSQPPLERDLAVRGCPARTGVATEVLAGQQLQLQHEDSEYAAAACSYPECKRAQRTSVQLQHAGYVVLSMEVHALQALIMILSRAGPPLDQHSPLS